jgi:hypothetical protein
VKFLARYIGIASGISNRSYLVFFRFLARLRSTTKEIFESRFLRKLLVDERGDVPGWVLVVLMTTGLVTAIWTIAAPRLTAILRNSLDSMNGIR